MKNVISTDKAPAAIGPYSQAIEVNGMVYTSGVIPVVPETGEASAELAKKIYDMTVMYSRTERRAEETAEEETAAEAKSF